MLSPTSRLASGRGFDASMAAQQVGDRRSRRSPRCPRSCSAVERVDVGRRRRSRPSSAEQLRPAARRGPRCPWRRGRRSARWRRPRWAGHVEVGAAGVGLALGAHERCAPHTGHVGGEHPPGRPSGRSASTGPTTSGMTSPALRTMTVSPGRTSLAAPGPRCAAWPRRRWSRRRTPARARRTAWPGRCARSTPGCRAAAVVRSSGGNL